MERKQMLDIWEAHCRYEFEEKNAELACSTMVEDAYVNHVPTKAGGRGLKELINFYAETFIPSIPPDWQAQSLSITVDDASQRLIEELSVRFTHDRAIPWLLPDVEATNKYLKIIILVVVQFRDGKMACERIYWDHASLLKQVGALENCDVTVLGVEEAEFVDNTL